MNIIEFEDSQYVFFKLVSNETIFAEYVGDSEDERYHIIRNPILIRSMQNQQTGADVLYGTDWAPYSYSKAHEIPSASVILKNHLGPRYVKFYGTILLKSLIETLQDEARDRIEEGESEIAVMHETLNKMEEIGNFLSAKFAIDAPDFSEMRDSYNSERERLLH